MSTQRIQARKRQIKDAASTRQAAPLPGTNATQATPIEQLPAYLTTRQVAAYMQLGNRTIANWCAVDKIHAARLSDDRRGGDWRIPREELARLLATG